MKVTKPMRTKLLLPVALWLALASLGQAQDIPADFPNPAVSDEPLPAFTDSEEPLASAFVEPRHDCVPPPCFAFSAEYLVLWFKADQVPPLVTTGNPNAAIPGALDQPGTR